MKSNLKTKVTEKEINEGIFKFKKDKSLLREQTAVFIRNFKNPSFKDINDPNEIFALKRYFEVRESRKTNQLEINKDLNDRVEKIKESLKTIYADKKLNSNIFEFNDVIFY